MTDKQLIQGLRKDDSKCFDEIFNRYYDECFAYAMSLLSDSQSTKDVLQNVFFKVWLGRDRLVPSKSLKGYIFTALRNEVISHLRLKYNVARRNEEIPEDLEAEHSDPMSSIIAGETDSLLQDVIERMPKQRRRAFELSRANMSAKEIAQIMNLSPRTVEHYIAAAKKEIKNRLS